MKNSLDQIEARLQAFIEGSAQILLWSSRQSLLAAKLVEALRNSILEQADGSLLAPASFTLFMSPDDYPYWETRQDLFDALAAVLQEAARDSGLFFPYPPSIRLAVDPGLMPGDLSVGAETPAKKVGSTAVLPVEQEKKSEGFESRPVNAFLIYENRNFPLRQAVVNIGRSLDNHLVVSDPRVSRGHAQLRAIRGRFVIFDLNSTGGTSVNGIRISQQTLHPGDVISLAGVPIVYGEEASTSASDTVGFQIRPDQPSDGVK